MTDDDEQGERGGTKAYKVEFDTATPFYKGLHHKVEPYLTWYSKTVIFFATKGVTEDIEKITLLASLIKESMSHSWIANSFEDHKKKKWDPFVEEMEKEALPSDWLDTILKKIKKIKFKDTKDFKQYAARGRNLQALIKTQTECMSDLELVENLVLGLPKELSLEIKKWQLLKVKPFNFHDFQTTCERYYTAAIDQATLKKQNPTTTTRTQTTTPTANPKSSYLPCDNFFWKLNSYLDHHGLCHFCKKHCGSVPGQCLNPQNQDKCDLSTWTPPPKPANHKPPKAQSSPPAANQTTRQPAGFPVNIAAAKEATTTDDNNRPEALEPVAIAAMDDLDARLEDIPGCVTQSRGPAGNCQP